MRVFGYGSLMWDGWEASFDCVSKELATLLGFRRDFNKASVRNWGTQANPGPTLGLDASEESECQGIVFEFPDDRREEILRELRRREGESFSLSDSNVVLASGASFDALVPLNDPSADTFIGDKTVDVRAQMARKAKGTSGSCVEYVLGIDRKLRELKIEDVAVREFAKLVAETGPQPQNKSVQPTARSARGG